MRRLSRLLSVPFAALLFGCDAEPVAPAAVPRAPAPAEPPVREGPAGARWEIVDALLTSRQHVFHPSDGGGRAWIEQIEPQPLRVGSALRAELVYEAGAAGIAVGGMLFLQISPFWSWSSPQTQDPSAAGYTTLRTTADGVELESEILDTGLLGIRIAGRALAAGERITIVYGDGEVGARGDRYAEREERFWFAVDGDGDGVRKVLADSPRLAIAPGPPAQLQLVIPGLARPGETVRGVAAWLDAQGNRGVDFSGVVELAVDGAGGAALAPLRFAAADQGVKSFALRAPEHGVLRLKAMGPQGIEANSNPLLVSRSGPRLLWGDLHGHSNLSDGTGTPEDYFAYARDVAGLDVAALTDHDHWGMLPLDAEPAAWQRIQQAAQDFHEPGRFVTLPGYEWTSWIHGHRHVLFFDEHAALWSSLDEQSDDPRELWGLLDGYSALTFAHHSAGGPVPTNWEIPPDPRFEPVTEIVSVHGSSEAIDAPGLIGGAVRGNFVRDVLDRGDRLGFIGSGDSHDGHPGFSQLASPQGGLAAILAEEATREGVLAALRARRTYATNGPRIVLRVALGTQPMGGTLRLADSRGEAPVLWVQVFACAPLERIDLIRSGEVADSAALDGELDVVLERPIEELRAGEYVYVRIVQRDGGAAWSSPIFIE